MQELENLRAQVERIQGVVPSVQALATKYADLLTQHKDDPAKVQELADGLRNSADALAAAVQAGS